MIKSHAQLSHPEPEDREPAAPAAEAPVPASGKVLKTLTEERDGKTRTIVVRTCNELLRSKLLELRDRESSPWSNSKIATRLGVSSGQVSQYLNERGCIYDGDIPGLERKIDDFLRNEERRRATGVVTTWCDPAEQMLKAFEYIRKTNDIGAIVAESGEGKTRGIDLIRETHPLAILFHVRAWSCDKNSLQSALWDVIPHVGYDSQQKRASFIVTSLRGSDRPLIVDDAHKLTRPALHLLFDLYEETNIPIALIGTEDILPKLEDDSQRFSRVGIHWPVKPDHKKGRKLLEHMVHNLCPKDTLNGDRDELLDLCEQVATQHGHFRSVEKQLKLAGELRSTGKLTWPQAFRSAHTLLLRQYQLT